MHQARDLIIQTAVHSHTNRWWQARAALVGIGKPPVDVSHLKTNPRVITEWGKQLDSLIRDGRARRALYLITAKIEEVDDIYWAETAWQRLPDIWRRLGLRGFHWQPELGLQALRQRLNERALPNWSSMVG